MFSTSLVVFAQNVLYGVPFEPLTSSERVFLLSAYVVLPLELLVLSDIYL